MNTNQNDPQQLDCHLELKTTAELKESVDNDLKKEDASLKDLLDGIQDDTKTSN